MAEPTLQEVHGAIGELRQEIEKKSVDPDKVERLNKALDDYEEKSQKIVADAKSAEAREVELKERLDALELDLSRGGAGNGADYRNGAEFKAMESFVRDGKSAVGKEEQKSMLRTDVATNGGVLVPSILDNEIIKGIEEVSDTRSVVRVRTVGGKTLDMPVRKGIPTATYEGEGKAAKESASSYGSEQATAWRQTFTTPITRDMLMDSAFNMETEMFSDAQLAFAVGEGRNVITGDGVKKPEGILSNAAVLANKLVTASSGLIDADTVMKIAGELKTGFNPMYAFTRQTLATLRTLKGSDGHYLWQPGMSGAVAAQLAGYNYRLMQDVPQIAGGNYAVIFGDFFRGYTMVDRASTEVIRDDYTMSDENIVRFTFHRYNTGRVTLSDAFAVVQIKA